MKNRRLLTAVASPLVIAVSGGSWAQEAPVFEEVLVTEEKRTESLQNLSQAVTALSAEAPGVSWAPQSAFQRAV